MRPMQPEAFASADFKGKHGGLVAVVDLQLYALGAAAVPSHLDDVTFGDGGAVYVECHTFFHNLGVIKFCATPRWPGLEARLA